MQNRNMYLYRRQGPKKRPKSGAPKKGRPPQKGLPGSARDLLPIIQPATKALAQMLAGRTGASGQLGHARAVLAQSEKLVSERAHNRLNPAEREEFFEQVARLKLTLADAESEAEFEAAEEQPQAAPPLPVDRERLKAMALSLTGSGARERAGQQASDDRESFEDTQRANSSPAALNEAPVPSYDATPTDDQAEASKSDHGEKGEKEESGSKAAAEPADHHDPKQLRLSENTANKLMLQSAAVGNADEAARRRRMKAKIASNKDFAERSPATADSATKTAAKTSAASKRKTASTAKADEGKSTAAGRQKLPKGWIIDDEGFVVPGPS